MVLNKLQSLCCSQRCCGDTTSLQRSHLADSLVTWEAVIPWSNVLPGDGSEEPACWLRPARLMCLPQKLIHNSTDLLLASALQVLSSKAGFNTISHGFIITWLTCIDLPSHQQYKCSPNIQQSQHPFTKHVPWQSCTSCQSPSCPSETAQCLLLTTLISPRVVSQSCECKKIFLRKQQNNECSKLATKNNV